MYVNIDTYMHEYREIMLFIGKTKGRSKMISRIYIYTYIHIYSYAYTYMYMYIYVSLVYMFT